VRKNTLITGKAHASMLKTFSILGEIEKKKRIQVQSATRLSA
jgi:hypothetical protein